MGPDGLLRRLLGKLGVDGALDEKICTLDRFDRVRFLEPAFDFSFPQGWEALTQSFCEAFPDNCRGLNHFLTDIRALWERGRTAFTLDGGMHLRALLAHERRSLREALDEHISDPVLTAVLSCHGILYGMHARETSLMFHSQVAGSYYESACLVQGGGRVWVEALEQARRDAGADVVCGHPVAHIRLDDQGRFAAVELETGDRLTASQCIGTMHPKLLLDMVPPNVLSPAYRRRVRELEETPSAVVLFGRCPSATLSGNLILTRQPRAIHDWEGLPLEERPMFVSASVGTDAVSVICPATLADVPGGNVHQDAGRPEGYRDWKLQLADRLVRRLSTYAGDLLGRFELLDMATPLTFRDRLTSPAGGLYGVKHRIVDLPLLPRTRVEGLYLSGQAIVAPGVLGALCAGFLTDSCVV